MSSRSDAQALLAKIVHRIDTNDDGTGFDRDDQFFLDKQLQVAQIKATLAVAEALEASTTKGNQG